MAKGETEAAFTFDLSPWSPMKNWLRTGWSKMPRCKAGEVLRNEAYLLYAAVTKNEPNAADGRFSTAC